MGSPRHEWPVAYAGPGALPRRCSSCSGEPWTRGDVADLDVVWLVAGRDGTPRAVRFCRGCRPGGRVGEVACEDCGDGPLLSGVFADPADLFTAAALQEWLEQTGWTHGSVCPKCSVTTARRRTERSGALPGDYP